MARRDRPAPAAICMWCEHWRGIDPTTSRTRECDGLPNEHLTPFHVGCAQFAFAERFRCGAFNKDVNLQTCATCNAHAKQDAPDVKICGDCESGKRARHHVQH